MVHTYWDPICQVASDETSFENTAIDRGWTTKGLLISQFIHSMTLTFGIHKGSCTTYFHITDYHCFGKIQGFTFFHSKSQGTKFDLDEKWVLVNQKSPFEQLGNTQSPDATYQVSKQSMRWFWGRSFLRFLPYMILAMWPGPFEHTLHPLLAGCWIWNLIETGPVVPEEKSFENIDKHSILLTLGQGYWMTLTFGIHRGSCSTYFHIIEYHCFGKMQCITFSPFNTQGTKSDLVKNGWRS